jgi:plastocyanin
MLSKRLVALALVVPLALGLAACGKSKKSASSSGASSSDVMKVTLTAKDFEFSPTTIDATPGEKFTITFKNTGSAEHNFSITSLKVNQDLEAGKTATVTFTAPSTAGDVQYFCEYHKDSKNMVGTLHVA